MALSTQALIKEADRCVACGLCLPHCPTYRKTGSEADSPRGRIQLMRAVAQDVLPNNDCFKQHIDLCLSCRSCESACPNNVNYGALIDATRAEFVQKSKVMRLLIKPFARTRGLSNAGIWLLWGLQKTPLLAWFKQLSPAAKLLPTLNKPVTWQPFYAATAQKRGAVSLFLGCTTHALDSQTITASITVLNQLGFDVHVPLKQTCCGGIARQMGDTKESSKLVQINQKIFDVNLPILSLASGCGAGLNDYLTTHRIEDISTFLASCDWSNVQLTPMHSRIFVQDPCTLKNVQKSHQAVYALLKRIPHAEVIPLAGNSQCCGGAGAYMLTQTAMAHQLLTDKLNAIQASEVSILATSNIGCSLHLASGLRARNLKVQVLHPVQIIAQQLGRKHTN
ncbi:MAG: (Fe-S)-binding protein [Methylotenera sp.]|nr:(Fe-S)-binding protein [Methylotenera sp.]